MADKKYNLLYIFTDQQRYDTLAAYGNRAIQTPHLNRLSQDCAIFDKTYVTQPVCTPSRGTLLTGLYPHNHRCVENNARLGEDVPTLAELIDDRDYAKGYIGKWHLGNEVIRQHGFDEWVSIEDVYRPHYSKEEYRQVYSDYHHFLLSKGYLPDVETADDAIFSRHFGTRLPEEHSRPAFVADRSVEFIRENKERPFVLYTAFLEPHPPYNSAYDLYYDADQIPLPPLFHERLGDRVPLRYQFNVKYQQQVGRQFPLNTEKAWRKLISHYWGAITLVDKSIGKILDCLKENGLWDRTVIVFTSDHGEMLGDYGMLQKMVMLESSVRVPLLVRLPSITDGGKRIASPVSQVDLLPTLIEAMGVRVRGQLDGRSLMPLIREEEGAPVRDVFIEWTGEEGEQRWFTVNRDPAVAERIKQVYGATVRTVVTPDGWKLSLQSAGEHELYHLREDPSERVNLYGDERYGEKASELTEKIRRWQAETGDAPEWRL